MVFGCIIGSCGVGLHNNNIGCTIIDPTIIIVLGAIIAIIPTLPIIPRVEEETSPTNRPLKTGWISVDFRVDFTAPIVFNNNIYKDEFDIWCLAAF